MPLTGDNHSAIGLVKKRDLCYAYSRTILRIQVLADHILFSKESGLPMDSSLQSANVAVDELSTSLDHHEETVGAEEEHHVHLPNPSWWPLILGTAILVAVI